MVLNACCCFIPSDILWKLESVNIKKVGPPPPSPPFSSCHVLSETQLTSVDDRLSLGSLYNLQFFGQRWCFTAGLWVTNWQFHQKYMLANLLTFREQLPYKRSGFWVGGITLEPSCPLFHKTLQYKCFHKNLHFSFLFEHLLSISIFIENWREMSLLE